MNGAESLVTTLVAHGVTTCFANPGTSEMHFVAAVDRIEGMRPILCLFEGVATGAADGYGRMLDRPAATLLHLGPGLANGLSNLHNAGRAFSPIVNVVGDHASRHRMLDAPLTSDIQGTARPFSHWVRVTPSADHVSADAAAAVTAALTPPGRIATLILPGDSAWNDLGPGADRGPAPLPAVPPRAPVSDAAVEAAVAVLRSGEPTAFVLAGPATRERSLDLAGRIAAATGARLFAQTHSPRITRGAGRVPVERIPYPHAQATAALAPYRTLILAGGKAPVAFFAYPGKPGEFYRPGTRLLSLARIEDAIEGALEAIAEALGVMHAPPPVARLELPESPSGTITPEKLGALIARLIPENAIVVDESITTGRTFMSATETARPHDWILPTGGSIGYGLPVAVGAAIACPDRKVLCLESDGSGLYMPQALWTMAREGLDVLTLIFANRKYQILRGELTNVGIGSVGPKGASLLDLDRPAVDWVAQARAFGVAARRAETMEELAAAMEHGLAERGPYLIEVVL